MTLISNILDRHSTRIKSEIYYNEVYRAIDWCYAESTTEAELLAHLDALYGRGRLPAGYTLIQLRSEASRQSMIDHLDSQHPDYEKHRGILERL